MAIAVGLVAAAVLVAGPLNPPAGPVASTYKTLTEVEPRIAINATNTPGDNDATPSDFKITVSGSYYLPASIIVSPGKIGIEIAAPAVTIDLNGFAVRGQAGSGDGISTSVSFATGGLCIRNGSVLFCANGIWANQANTVIEGLVVDDNLGTGITTAGSGTVSRCVVSGGTSGISVGVGSLVLDCTATGASTDGIVAFNASAVMHCTASGNGAYGINAGIGSTITGCSARLNSTGIGAGGECAVSDCSAVLNTTDGIIVGNGGKITGCTAGNNANSGIGASTGCTVANCSSYGNGVGVSAGAGCTVADCSACNNLNSGITSANGSAITRCTTSGNGASGISTGSSSTVIGCLSTTNHDSGLSVSFYCSAIDCTATSNGLDGISAGQGCQLRGNTCSANGTDPAGGAGIHITATDCRLEGNICNQNDRGIDIDFGGNLVIRNACAGNTTDWDIVANNIVAPIVDRRAPASAAIVGFSFAGSLGSTDPNANFSY